MIDDKALDALFRSARTANAFTAEPVSDAQLRQVYDLLKMGPTASNGLPGRFVFLRSREAREPTTCALARQPRQDDACAGHRDRRARHPFS